MKNIQTQPYFVDKRHVFTKKKKLGKLYQANASNKKARVITMIT